MVVRRRPPRTTGTQDEIEFDMRLVAEHNGELSHVQSTEAWPSHCDIEDAGRLHNNGRGGKHAAAKAELNRSTSGSSVDSGNSGNSGNNNNSNNNNSSERTAQMRAATTGSRSASASQQTSMVILGGADDPPTPATIGTRPSPLDGGAGQAVSDTVATQSEWQRV